MEHDERKRGGANTTLGLWSLFSDTKNKTNREREQHCGRNTSEPNAAEEDHQNLPSAIRTYLDLEGYIRSCTLPGTLWGRFALNNGLPVHRNLHLAHNPCYETRILIGCPVCILLRRSGPSTGTGVFVFSGTMVSMNRHRTRNHCIQ